ncbi:alpha-galactosidase [Paenibacillus sp. MMS20-IR301]|uniref:glycoside hydrolase family 36 protein n=1 Tax=Paenibacillus sp. MMS20-IR301 TaxID=2895946 RepID=UPI0028EB74D8|nr:alpha-galactosidase [Paenibacillus sp. MMS20-IR301]WNS45421.1 alpha-galactosidase [Paenibacillus sp. MMS20-IR301]
MKSIQAGKYEITLEGNTADFQAQLHVHDGEEGVAIVTLTLSSPVPALPPELSLRWSCKAVDVQGIWHPAAERSRSLLPDWRDGFRSRATLSAPVISLYGNRGNNLLTFACSDVLNPLELAAGLNEETSRFQCSVGVFAGFASPLTRYAAMVRLDSRNVPYYEALDGTAQWWVGLEGNEPAAVPELAKEPVYSTWYSFHQQLAPDRIVEECRLAAGLGCHTVIVDDGWQTSDEARGYAYCGDWKASPGKIADMRALVTRVHELGMKFMLWYAVPFIGKHSEAWRQFQNKLLYYSDSFGAGVADPRYPEVREYLISLYEQALLDWDLDGFKLDFVDSFYADGEGSGGPDPGWDTDSVPAAADLLLSGVLARLRRLKPDIMIEFRQNYTGPLMRKYGNMFRAADCPNDALQNRLHTIDIRLICGDTAAHTDMLMWNPEESPESAALQIINVLFAVPQISVRLAALPEQHMLMLAFWLAFWREHREVLLEGRLEPLHPELLYPLVIARSERKWVFAAYYDTVLPLTGEWPEQVLVINGTLYTRLVLELDRDPGALRITIRDCRGTEAAAYTTVWTKGVYVLEVPAAGVISIRSARG